MALEELRAACGVSRDGSKASNIVKAARTYGLEAKGYKKEPSGLTGLPLPLIVFWNFNHFVVLEGIKGRTVYLNDPATGPRRVTWDEFDRSYTGVVLAFRPGPDFKKGGAKPGLRRSLRGRLAGSSAGLTFVFLAGLFLVVPGLALPVFARVFVDQVLIGNLSGWLTPLLLGMALTALVRGGLTWLQRHYLLRLETRFALAESARFFKHVLRLPMDFFQHRLVGDIASRIGLNDKVAALVSGDLAGNLLNVVMIVFYAALMFQYDRLLTAFGVLAVLLNLTALRLVARKRTDLNQRLQQEAGKLMGVSMNGLQLIETIKATGSESDFFARWAGQQAKVINAQQALAVPNQLLTVAPTLLLALNHAVILSVGGFRVMNGQMSMGMLVAFQSLMAGFMLPVVQMMNLGGRFQEAMAELNRLDDVLRHPPEKRIEFGRPWEEPGHEHARKLDGRVEVKGMTFGYSRLEPPLIENFDLRLEPGSRVALVGGSGSGKSTVARLIMGLYQPWAGEILFDNRPLDRIPRSVFNDSVAMVDQDIFLFEGAIRDNLTLWDDSIPENDLIQAAKDACIHYDIGSRPGGYGAQVEEGGRNFSGGQCQRLEIARALAGNPAVLVLDEATSALDPRLEMIVDDRLAVAAAPL